MPDVRIACLLGYNQIRDSVRGDRPGGLETLGKTTCLICAVFGRPLLPDHYFCEKIKIIPMLVLLHLDDFFGGCYAPLVRRFSILEGV
jgi:hypothetical protein